MKNNEEKQQQACLINVFRVLSDPIRFNIVSLLLKEEKHLSCEDYDVAKSTLSHHIKLLKEAGVIMIKKEGVSHVYSLSPDFYKAYPELVEVIRRKIK